MINSEDKFCSFSKIHRKTQLFSNIRYKNIKVVRNREIMSRSERFAVKPREICLDLDINNDLNSFRKD
jgi:hypothetical protein